MAAKFHLPARYAGVWFLASIMLGLGWPLYADEPLFESNKPASSADSTTIFNWATLSSEQKQLLLMAYKNLRPLDDKDQQTLQQRLDWFSQLSKAEQQRMREVWQNMSNNERDYWKNQLKTASREQREELRNKIMAKYD